jgi:hypothetical protein
MNDKVTRGRKEEFTATIREAELMFSRWVMQKSDETSYKGRG